MPRLPIAVASLAMCTALLAGCQTDKVPGPAPDAKNVPRPGDRVSKEACDRILLGMAEMDVNALLGREPDAIVPVNKDGSRRRCQWFAPGATIEVDLEADRTRPEGTLNGKATAAGYETAQTRQIYLRRVTGKVFYTKDMSAEWYPGMTPAQWPGAANKGAFVQVQKQ
jgi:hypothetical protein